MSIMTVKGNPKWKNGIPRNSRCRIEVMPSRIPVFDQVVSKQVMIDLDPGLYAISVSKYLGVNANKRHSMMTWGGLRLHDLTQHQYNVLSNMRTKHCSGRMTGDGYIISCNLTGCDFTTKTSVSAIMHELEHRGITLEQITAEDTDLHLAETLDMPAPQPPADELPGGMSFTSASLEVEEDEDAPAFKLPDTSDAAAPRRPRGRPRKS